MHVHGGRKEGAEVALTLQHARQPDTVVRCTVADTLLSKACCALLALLSMLLCIHAAGSSTGVHTRQLSLARYRVTHWILKDWLFGLGMMCWPPVVTSLVTAQPSM